MRYARQNATVLRGDGTKHQGNMRVCIPPISDYATTHPGFCRARMIDLYRKMALMTAMHASSPCRDEQEAMRQERMGWQDVLHDGACGPSQEFRSHSPSVAD